MNRLFTLAEMVSGMLNAGLILIRIKLWKLDRSPFAESVPCQQRELSNHVFPILAGTVIFSGVAGRVPGAEGSNASSSGLRIFFKSVIGKVFWP